MKITLLTPTPFLTLLYTLTLSLVPAPVLANSNGVVDCTLEWHSGHQMYTYVFSGVVSNQGHPTPHAKIQLQLSTPNQPDQIQETEASADGTYELKVAVDGQPQQSAEWKLIAQAPENTSVTAEIEGRAILTEDESVTVNRPLQLVQG